MKKIGHITLLVHDMDDARDYYVNKLGFTLKSDHSFGKGNRWLTVAPSEESHIEIVFVKADTAKKNDRVGSQAGEHVFLTLQTDDFDRDYKKLLDKGVSFLGDPQDQFYGKEVILEDLYGNRLDLIQPK